MGLLDDLDALTAAAPKWPMAAASKSTSAASSSRAKSTAAAKKSATVISDDDDDVAMATSAPPEKPKAKRSKTTASAGTTSKKAPTAASKASGSTAVARKPSGSSAKAKAKATEEEEPSKATSSRTADDANRMPYYEGWTLKDLQAEVKNFGFRTSKDRNVLIDQLTACYRALHSNVEVPPHIHEYDDESLAGAEGDVEMRSPARHSGARRKEAARPENSGDTTVRSTWSGMASDSDLDMGDLTLQLAREAAESIDDSDSDVAMHEERDGTISLASNSDGEVDQAEPSPSSVPLTLATSLARAVRADKQLYRRILLLEPISFDEVQSVATKAGIKVKSREVLRDWLDAQGIVFYFGELTGARSRY